MSLFGFALILIMFFGPFALIAYVLLGKDFLLWFFTGKEYDSKKESEVNHGKK